MSPVKLGPAPNIPLILHPIGILVPCNVDAPARLVFVGPIPLPAKRQPGAIPQPRALGAVVVPRALAPPALAFALGGRARARRSSSTLALALARARALVLVLDGHLVVRRR